MRKFLGSSLSIDTQIICKSKADAEFPVVSAASICAKVSRDQLLKDWEFREEIAAKYLNNQREEAKLDLISGFDKENIEKKFSRQFGCGYPGDPKTKDWLQQSFDPVFGFPSIVRFSWKTCVNIMEAKKAQIKWHDLDPNDQKEKLKQQSLPKFETDRRKINIATKKVNIRRKFEL